MIDQSSEIKILKAVNTTAVTGNGATAGDIIDLSGWGSATFVFRTGTLTDGVYTPSFVDGDAADLTGGAAVAAGDLIGTIAKATYTATDAGKATAESNVCKKIGYRGTKRYIRATVTAASVTAGGNISCSVVLGNPCVGPLPQP